MGQWNSTILYEAGVNGIGARLMQNGISYYRTFFNDDTDSTHVLIWNQIFENSNPTEITSSNELDIKYNYFVNNNPANWRTDVPSYANVTYSNMYSNIDLKYYSTKLNTLKYDFRLKPGFDINSIVSRYDGVNNITLNANGDLLVNTVWGQLKEIKPYSYQLINGVEVPVNISYRIISSNKFGFQINGSYNAAYDIILDPVAIQWSTFIGDNGTNSYLTAMDVQSTTGKVYGVTRVSINGTSFPVSPGILAYNGAFGTLSVFRLNENGTTLERATFIGSGIDEERATDIKVDVVGNKVCIVGWVNNNSYPIYNPNNYGPTLNSNGRSAFLSVLGINLNILQHSNLFGGVGDDVANAIEVIGNNDYVIGGYTASPTFYGATMPNSTTDRDAFLVRYNITTPGFTFATVRGGSNSDEINSIHIDAASRILAVGTTASTNFPVTVQSFGQSFSAGSVSDMFVQRYNLSGTVINSAFLGSEREDRGIDITSDANNDIYVLGMLSQASSISTQYPLVGNSFKTSTNCTNDGLLTRINNAFSSILYSSYYGFINTVGRSIPGGIKVISPGNVVVVGTEARTNGNTVSYNGCDFQNSLFNALEDVYFSQYDMPSNTLQSFTYLGGDNFDYEVTRPYSSSNNVWFGLTSHSSDFPTTNGAYLNIHPPLRMPSSSDLADAPVVMKCLLYNPASNAVVNAGPDKTVCLPGSVQIGGTPTSTTNIYNNGVSSPSISYSWSSQPNDPNFDNQASNPVVSPTVTTTYTVTVTTIGGCTLGTDAVVVTVRNPPALTINPEGGSLYICSTGENKRITVTAVPVTQFTSYQWNGPGIVSGSNSATITVNAPGIYTVTVSDGFCTSSAGIVIGSVNCCQGTVQSGINGNQTLTFSTVTASTLLSIFGTSGTGTITTAQKIAINNALIADVNLTFLTCPQVTFGKDAVLNISSGKKLTVDNSTLKSCDGLNMWLGIRESGSTSTVEVKNNSVIRDAGIAIQSNANAKVITSTGAQFIDNFMGIQLNNSAGGLQVSIQRTTFKTGDATTNLLTVPSAVIGLYPVSVAANFSFTRSYLGIEVNNATNLVNIASIGPELNYNYFYKLECGIYMLNSPVNLTYNTVSFANKVGPGSPTNDRRGWATFFNSTGSTIYLHKIGTSTIFAQNRIEGCDNGSRVLGKANLSIGYNYYKGNTNISLFIQNLSSCPTATINNNRIQSTNTGISWLLNTATPVNIEANEVSTTENGIYLADNNNTTVAKNITLNDIFETRYGIQTVGLSNATITSNYVKMNPNQFQGLDKVGIIVSNSTGGLTCNQNFIDGNYLGATPGAISRGIATIASPNCTFQCDSVVRCEWGFRVQGNCSPTPLRSNAMRDCTAGVVIDGQGAQVGGQLWVAAPPFGFSTNDNKWWGNMGTYFLQGHTRCINQANGTLSTFYFRNPSVGAEFFPSPFRNFNDGFSPSTPSTIWNNVPYAQLGCTNNYNTNKVDETLAGNVETAEKIVYGEIEYTPDVEEYLEQWDKETLYKQLKEDEDLRLQSTVLDSFYIANQYSELGKTIVARQWASWAADSASADAALVKVEAMNPQNQSELNTKTVQQIYLQVHSKDNSVIDSTQLSMIEGIARQCFVFGGPSVFLARSMYNAAKGVVDNSFVDYCLENFNSYKTDPEKVQTVATIGIFPNPSDNHVGFFIESSVKAKGVLSNSIGQVVKTIQIDLGTTHLLSSDLAPDIYQIVFKTEMGENITYRLIVK